MRKGYGLKRDLFDERDYKFAAKMIEKVEIPIIDLSPNMPAIVDQLALGSCTANSTTRAFMYARKAVNVMLSRLFQYYKTREIEGTTSEDSGASNRDAAKSTNKNGICSEKYMPYDILKFAEEPSLEAVSDASTKKSLAYYSLSSIDEVFTSLAKGIPVVIGMDVYESFESKATAKTGVMQMPVIAERLLGGHSVLIEGKNDVLKFKRPSLLKRLFNMILGISTPPSCKGYFKVANSWGADWGDEGYFYMPYDYFNHFTYDYWCIM